MQHSGNAISLRIPGSAATTGNSTSGTAMSEPLFTAIVAAPGFRLGIRCDDDEIEEISFLEAGAEMAPVSLLAAEAARQLSAYLRDPQFVFGLPLRPQGTPFQRRVWAGIASIPPGRTLSYGDLAKSLKSAPRAVGGACGANPYPLNVPPLAWEVSAASAVGTLVQELVRQTSAIPSPTPISCSG
jgi:methylated-DNA-[protein]-cysteine S-methyltransferase